MNHDTIKEKLLAFYDQELPQNERDEILTHLGGCPECDEIMKVWENARLMFSKVPAPESPELFVRNVMNRIHALEQRAEEPARGFVLPKWLMPVLGYGFAFGLMFLAISYREQPVWGTEGLLIANMPQESQWAFDAETPETAIFNK